MRSSKPEKYSVFLYLNISLHSIWDPPPELPPHQNPMDTVWESYAQSAFPQGHCAWTEESMRCLPFPIRCEHNDVVVMVKTLIRFGVCRSRGRWEDLLNPWVAISFSQPSWINQNPILALVLTKNIGVWCGCGYTIIRRTVGRSLAHNRKGAGCRCGSLRVLRGEWWAQVYRCAGKTGDEREMVPFGREAKGRTFSFVHLLQIRVKVSVLLVF